MSQTSQHGAELIRLAELRATSTRFKTLYAQGMGLVEETAAYLDGEGRRDSQRLTTVVSSLYATESMRLTTRLMQLASWLLLQRAANSGEMTRQQVVAEKAKVRLDTKSSNQEVVGWEELPEAFASLVRRSMDLQRQVGLLDDEIYGDNDGHDTRHDANPISEQINLLKTAFSKY